MAHTDLLQTIAQVATAFAGFSGIVVALGGRAAGQWRTGNAAAIGGILASSLGAVFFAFVPEVVAAADIEPSRAWRLSALALAIHHFLTIAYSVWLRRRVSRAHDPLVWRALSVVLALGGIAFAGTLLVAGLGVLERWLVFLYLVNLLWMLLVAVTLFALLLFDIVAARTDEQA